MGMFDEVICELPLPDGWKHPVFQTKDFEDPYLDKYVIRADGRLIRKKPWYECEIKADTDMNYHGLLRFYSYEGDPNDDTPLAQPEVAQITPAVGGECLWIVSGKKTTALWAPNSGLTFCGARAKILAFL
jgi:hypothetical protein